VRRRLQSWLPGLIEDLSDLLGRREIFWELQEVVRNNERILSPAAFLQWMTTNYLISVNVGVRRLTDASADVHSLWRLLYEILRHPGVINRRANRALYGSAPFDLADRSFDNIVGPGRDLLNQQAVRADLRAIEDASERVRRFTNKRIAHRTLPHSIRRLPTYRELDQALDVLDKQLCKYNTLLTAGGLSTTHATRQYNWQEVLREAWIPPGHPLRGPA
jgi:hypothetical protein